MSKETRTKAFAVKKGKTTTLKASITKAKKTTVRKHVGPRFESSNKKVVKVPAKGKVKGIKKGTAKIYVFAQNGVCRTISVTVR